MLGIYTYAPEDIQVSLSGYNLKDFAAGTFVEVIPNNPSFTRVGGIRGKSTRVRQRDKSGTVIIKIQQTSPVNDLLSKIVLMDEIQMTGLLELTIKDLGGSTTNLFKNCYISQIDKLAYTDEDTTAREWRINYEVLGRYYIGGNRMPSLDFLKVFN